MLYNGVPNKTFIIKEGVINKVDFLNKNLMH